MTDSKSKSQSVVVWQRLLNRPIQFGLDMVVLLLAFWISYLIRFEFSFDHETWMRLLTQAPMVALVQVSALFVAGVYSFVWRYIGMAEISAFVKAGFW